MEEHLVTTADGYILKVIRVPGSESNPPASGKKVVFLQHGLLCSSADWVVLGPGKSIVYLLVEAGYDVWLGNARGKSKSSLSMSKFPYKYFSKATPTLENIPIYHLNDVISGTFLGMK